MLAPSQNGLAHQVEFVGFMGGAMGLLIDYSRFEMLYKGLLRQIRAYSCIIVRAEGNS